MSDVQPTVPEEAVRVAKEAAWNLPRADQAMAGIVAEVALAAAVPVIEKHLRARLADEIAAAAVHEHVGSWHPHAALIFAARLVRGEQP